MNESMTEAPVREVVVARLRPHVRVLFWPTVLLLAVCAAYGYFGGRYVDGWPAIAIAAATAPSDVTAAKAPQRALAVQPSPVTRVIRMWPFRV